MRGRFLTTRLALNPLLRSASERMGVGVLSVQATRREPSRAPIPTHPLHTRRHHTHHDATTTQNTSTATLGQRHAWPGRRGSGGAGGGSGVVVGGREDR